MNISISPALDATGHAQVPQPIPKASPPLAYGKSDYLAINVKLEHNIRTWGEPKMHVATYHGESALS